MNPAHDEPTDVLARWHEAVNAGDVEAAVALCSGDVAVAGPRGVGHGRDLVRAWLTRSGIRLSPALPLPGTDGRHVVEERARWTTPDAPAGVPSAEPAQTWCVFAVTGGQVAEIARYESAEEAAAAAAPAAAES